MLTRVMERVVVVGAGLTGAVSASLLRQQADDKFKIVVWEKSRDAGGRMSTSRNPENADCTVDLGAQYISATPDYFIKHSNFYNELLQNGTLRALESEVVNMREGIPETKHFVAPAGISSLVKYFLAKSGATISFDSTLSRVDVKDDQWQLTAESGQTELCDCLLLTMPVPQMLQLVGHVIDAESRTSLADVTYSSRYAVGLYYEQGTTINVPWGAKYIKGDDCIVFVAIDNKKRGIDSAPSVVVHASVPFSLKHLQQDLDAVCHDLIIPRVRQLVPELPEPATIKPHRWMYSQVFKPYVGTPGAIVLRKNPLLICAGDGFMHSNFDGCVKSAETAVGLVLQQAKL